MAGDTRVTCTACAGTLLLEFGLLSRLTGDPKYERQARQAVEKLWGECVGVDVDVGVFFPSFFEGVGGGGAGMC